MSSTKPVGAAGAPSPTDWSRYLWPPLGNTVGGGGNCMRIIGTIEIVVAFLVAFNPKIGAPIVAARLGHHCKPAVTRQLLRHRFARSWFVLGRSRLITAGHAVRSRAPADVLTAAMGYASRELLFRIFKNRRTETGRSDSLFKRIPLVAPDLLPTRRRRSIGALSERPAPKPLAGPRWVGYFAHVWTIRPPLLRR